MAILDREDPDPIPDMTAERFFKYCRVAYQANPRTFRGLGFKRGLAGRDYYKRYAWHDFPREWNVADCIQLQWILEANPGRNRALSSKLRQLISWLPEQVSAHLHDR